MKRKKRRRSKGKRRRRRNEEIILANGTTISLKKKKKNDQDENLGIKGTFRVKRVGKDNFAFQFMFPCFQIFLIMYLIIFVN